MDRPRPLLRRGEEPRSVTCDRAGGVEELPSDLEGNTVVEAALVGGEDEAHGERRRPVEAEPELVTHPEARLPAEHLPDLDRAEPEVEAGQPAARIAVEGVPFAPVDVGGVGAEHRDAIDNTHLNPLAGRERWPMVHADHLPAEPEQRLLRSQPVAQAWPRGADQRRSTTLPPEGAALVNQPQHLAAVALGAEDHPARLVDRGRCDVAPHLGGLRHRADRRRHRRTPGRGALRAGVLDSTGAASRPPHALEQRHREHPAHVLLEDLVEVLEQIVREAPVREGRAGVAHILVPDRDPVHGARPVFDLRGAGRWSVGAAVDVGPQQRVDDHAGVGVPVRGWAVRLREGRLSRAGGGRTAQGVDEPRGVRHASPPAVLHGVGVDQVRLLPAHEDVLVVEVPDDHPGGVHLLDGAVEVAQDRKRVRLREGLAELRLRVPEEDFAPLQEGHRVAHDSTGLVPGELAGGDDPWWKTGRESGQLLLVRGDAPTGRLHGPRFQGQRGVGGVTEDLEHPAVAEVVDAGLATLPEGVLWVDPDRLGAELQREHVGTSWSSSGSASSGLSPRRRAL